MSDIDQDIIAMHHERIAMGHQQQAMAIQGWRDAVLPVMQANMRHQEEP